MSSVNPLLKRGWSKHSWGECQRFQLENYAESSVLEASVELRVAFPGSMLFNHLLVGCGDEQHCTAENIVVPDVSDIVYDYCGSSARGTVLSHAIVVDAESDSIDATVVSVLNSFYSDTSFSEIIILGESLFHTFSEVNADERIGDLNVSWIEPGWRSPAALHRIYRRAGRLVFLNTMRVLDAAFTGCDCILIADDEFRGRSIFPVLHHLLDRTECLVLDSSGAVLRCASGTPTGNYRIANNTVADLERAIQEAGSIAEDFVLDVQNAEVVQNPNTVQNTEWLSQLVGANTDSVIITEMLAEKIEASRWTDLRTRWLRKMEKLWRDPHAFFSDSGNVVLQLIARAFFSTRQAG